MRRILIACTTILLFCVGCSKPQRVDYADDEDSIIVDDNLQDALPAASVLKQSDFNFDRSDMDADMLAQANASVEVLKRWNDGLNNRNEALLSQQYTSMIMYYGSEYSRDEVHSDHHKFFEKHPYYYQAIGNVKVDVMNSCRVGVSFDKFVQTEPGGKYKVYNSYLRFTGYDTSWEIIREGDTTTDRNLAKRKVGVASVSVDNETPLEDIFCAQNVGKYLEADYWSLVLSSDDGETEGPLASAMIEEGATARLFISGILKRNYRGRSGTIYCGGICEAGESEAIVVWVYDTHTGTLSCEY